MLGETYELVTKDFRYFSEQVSHHPPISAFVQEGPGYVITGSLFTKSKLGFGGGTGLMTVANLTPNDYFFEQHDETITVTKPEIVIQNLVLGTLYIDFEGKIVATNQRTNERATVEFYPRGWTTSSYLTGSICDAYGNEVYKIDGAAQDKVYYTRVATGERKVLWERDPPFEDSDRQFNWNLVNVNLNYVCPEMSGVVAPTDTRFRGDQRLYEEGKEDAADEEKIRLEVKQRKARKERADAGVEWQPQFFNEVDHPHMPGVK